MTRGDTRNAFGAFAAGVGALLSLRWVRVVLALLVLFVVARLALGRVLWAAVDRVAESRGLACTWEDLDLSLLSGRAEVSWLELRPREAPADEEPLLALEYGGF